MEKAYFKGETNIFEIHNRTFEEFHGITMACITLNEEVDMPEFLKHIRPVVSKIVVVDGGSTDRTVELASVLADSVKIVPYNGHLGNQKNNAIAMSMTDWTLFLDPDERLTEQTIKMLPDLINQDEFDCYAFPRREFISGNENPAPYPDYQDRLFRTYCRYIRPVHHELVGYKNKCTLPVNSGIDIIHSKELSRHNMRNSGHMAFNIHYKHEMSFPGSQMKGSFEKNMRYLNGTIVRPAEK